MTKRLLFVLLLLGPPAVSASETPASCITGTCHSTFAQRKAPHPPGNTECSLCHRQDRRPDHPVRGSRSFNLTNTIQDICFSCHPRIGKAKNVHAPVKSGECTLCHNPHDSGEVKGKDLRQLCFRCHDKEPFTRQHNHGPVVVGSCMECHDPHESSEAALLKKPARELCLGCHADFGAAIKQSPVVHFPVKEQSCTFCHSPHSSKDPFLVKKKLPELCIDCHDRIGRKMKEKTVHKPLTNDKSCGNCHSSHFSKAPALLAQDEKGVCLGCHNTGKLGTPPLKNIKKELGGEKHLHGPVKGACSVCHDPHGSDYVRMLRGSYPQPFYAPYQDGIYDFCLKCHNKNLLRFDRTTIYTRFRNGDKNLHFVHVANKHKGRTCRACHEPHAGSGEKLTSVEGISFGKWNVPIEFKRTETGGSCAPGCHAPFKYDREKPEVYPNGN